MGMFCSGVMKTSCWCARHESLLPPSLHLTDWFAWLLATCQQEVHKLHVIFEESWYSVAAFESRK